MSGARRRFRFIKEIAEGGFGKVYLAEQLSQDGFSRIVALKLLHQKWSSHDEIVMRTRDEARLLGLIRHQHIVRVEDLTSVDGKLAIVMEYLEGVDLKGIMGHLMERGQHFPRQALFEIMIAVAGALDAAYNGEPLQGGEPLRVIHRDIKPSNVFVTVNGGVKVLDFGTARANFDAREAKTQALAFGSQGYMAPERMLGEEDTPAADVFSLGVTLHEMLSLEPFGRIPPRPNKFASKIEEKVASTPLEGDPEWVEQVREVLLLMMAYEPAERPSAKQLIDIFEILAQDANDMGLRRFCRVVVAEAKAAVPDLESGDPLTGNVIEEDPSSVWGMDSGPLGATVDDLGAAPTMPPDPPPPPAPASKQASTPAPATRSATPKRPSQQSRPQPAAQAIAAPPPEVDDGFGDLDEEDEAPPKKRGGFLRLVVIAVVVVVVLGLLGTGIIAAVAAIALVASQSDTSIPTLTSTETPEDPETPETPETPAEPEVDLPNGSRVVAEDRRGDKTPVSKKTVLKLEGDKAALVTLSGSAGFKAEWDGMGDYDVGKMPAGRYRTFVTPVSTGQKIRGATFEIEEGKTCTFTFQVSKENWEGSCK